MKEKIITALKNGLNYILKPFIVIVSFSFAMGRAYERVVALSTDGYYTKFGGYYRR